MRDEFTGATAAIIMLRNGAGQGSVSLGGIFQFGFDLENQVSFLGICKQEVEDL